jgi:hypothetical protein
MPEFENDEFDVGGKMDSLFSKRTTDPPASIIVWDTVRPESPAPMTTTQLLLISFILS